MVDSEKSISPDKMGGLNEDEIIEKNIIESLMLFINDVKARNKPLSHILFYGPSIAGETLANVFGRELGVNVRITNGSSIERPGDMGAILTNLKQGDIVLIKEINDLPQIVQEVLYEAMHDFKMEIIIGSGNSQRNVHLELPRFTIIGTISRTNLPEPNIDNFSINIRLTQTLDIDINQAKDDSSIYDKVIKFIKNDYTPSPIITIRDERELESNIKTLIEYKFGNIIQSKTSNGADIVFSDDKGTYGIELKLGTNRNNLRDLIGQAKDYSRKYKKLALLIYYDSVSYSNVYEFNKDYEDIGVNDVIYKAGRIQWNKELS